MAKHPFGQVRAQLEAGLSAIARVELLLAISLAALVFVALVARARPWIGRGAFLGLVLCAWLCAPLLSASAAPSAGPFPSADRGSAGQTESAGDRDSPPASAAATLATMQEKARRTFGPEDGDLDPISGRISAYTTGVIHRDFMVEARFSNPGDGQQTVWDYGFVFRWTPDNRAYMFFVRNDQSWGLQSTENVLAGQWQPVSAGSVPNLDRSADGSNRVRLAVEGGEALLLVNDEHIATLDVSKIASPGSVLAVSNTRMERRIPSRPTRYEALTVWSLRDRARLSGASTDQQTDAAALAFAATDEARRTFGPEDGAIPHLATRLSTRLADATRRDFIAEARVHNPYGMERGRWDFGFIFRGTEEAQYLLSVDCTGVWFLVLGVPVEGYFQRDTIASGRLDNLDTSATGSNLVRLTAQGEAGLLTINGQDVGALDLSDNTSSGRVEMAFGFWDTRRKPGVSTRYEGFTVWSLD